MFGRKIIITWLIICILTAIVVVGCATPKYAESHVPLPPLASMLREMPSLQVVVSQQDIESPTPSKRKILTLREEMQRFEDHQTITDNKIDSVARELSTVKTEVEILKNSVSGTFEPKSTAKSGIPNKAKTENNEIVSDEVAYKTPMKSSPKQPIKHNKPIEIHQKKSISQKVEPKDEDEIKPDEKLKKQAESTKTDTASKPIKSGSLYHNAMNLISKKQYDEAIGLLSEVIKSEKNPETLANSYYWLGESNFGTGKFDQAIFYFQKVNTFKNSTKLDDSQLMIAESYQRLGRNEEARKAFQKLVDYFPTSEYVPRAKKMLQRL